MKKRVREWNKQVLGYTRRNGSDILPGIGRLDYMVLWRLDGERKGGEKGFEEQTRGNDL